MLSVYDKMKKINKWLQKKKIAKKIDNLLKT